MANVFIEENTLKEIGEAIREKTGKNSKILPKNMPIEIRSIAGVGGGFVYPEGAFAPVTSFTDGKQYALVALIEGSRRYINNTNYNDYTMNATAISISEDAGDYVLFDSTPILFTAVASGDGFLLQNGSNYLHGSTSNGTALRVGTTESVWTLDYSDNGGFSDGKYYAKEDSNAVWLVNNDGTYNWGIKYETAGSFGYDRDGRDGTYSTGFVSFVLYEYVAGEGELNPIMDTSDGNLSASKMLEGAIGFSNGRRCEGNIPKKLADSYTPTTTDQKIERGQYLDGDQTIKGDANLVASNIKKGTSIFGVTGNYEGASGYAIKRGTTTSGTINTGLSSVQTFILWKDAVAETGVIQGVYDSVEGTSYTYCSSYSSYSSRYAVGSTAPTVSGGTVTWKGTSTQGLSSGKTYNWIAIGEE